MNKIRYPAVAGSFYEGTKESLIKRLEWCFKHKLGPGKLPSKTIEINERVIGIISPHAGYIYSGPIAAHGYYEISRRPKAHVYVLIGPNHHGIGAPIAISKADLWRTPLGDVKVDHEIAKKLIDISKLIEYDDEAHMYEHSVEVQIPFLQYVLTGEINIVPISMLLQNPDISKEIGNALYKLSKKENIYITVIASTDFTHYEPHEIAKRKDKMAIDCILKGDYKALYDVIIENNITMCGPGPVMTLLAYASNFSNVRIKLLKYATSGDITGDYTAVVGYASIIITASSE